MRISTFITKTLLYSLFSIISFINSAHADLKSIGYVAELKKDHWSDLAQLILKVAPNVLRMGTGSGTILYRAKNGGAIVWTASHIFPGAEGRAIDASIRSEPENMGAEGLDWKTGTSQVFPGSFVFSEALPMTGKLDRWIPSFDFKVIQLKIETSVNALPLKKSGTPRFILGYPKGGADLVYSLCGEAPDYTIEIISKAGTYPVDENVEGVALCRGIEGMSGGGVFDGSGNYIGHLVRGGTLESGEYIRYVKASFAAKTLKLKMKDYTVLN